MTIPDARRRAWRALVGTAAQASVLDLTRPSHPAALAALVADATRTTMVARKGQPNLTNDPGKRAGWEYRAVKGINRDAFTRGYYQAGVTFFAALRQAANSRGMPTSAYLRRAVAAFAARDLGVEFEDILKDSPAPDQAQGRDPETGTWTRRMDDGSGYGTWEVK